MKFRDISFENVKKQPQSSPFLKTRAKEALNFALSVFLISVGLGIVGMIGHGLGCITLLARVAVGIGTLVLGIFSTKPVALPAAHDNSRTARERFHHLGLAAPVQRDR